MDVRVDGADLYCSVRGQGPVCLVPSAIGTKPYETQMPPPLTDLLTLVHVDLRGGGRSTGRAEDLTFDLLADDFEAIRRTLGVDRVAVLGHSILGMLAIEYGRRRPASVSHVIAVGTPPIGDMATVSARASAYFEADASPERKAVLRENMAKVSPGADRGERLLAQTPTRFFDARTDAAPLYAGAEVRMVLLGHLMGTLAPAWSVTGARPTLTVPLMVAHGRYDYTVPASMWEDVVGQLPDATLSIFGRSGHQPFWEEPEAFAAAIGAWMGRR